MWIVLLAHGFAVLGVSVHSLLQGWGARAALRWSVAALFLGWLAIAAWQTRLNAHWGMVRKAQFMFMGLAFEVATIYGAIVLAN